MLVTKVVMIDVDASNDTWEWHKNPDEPIVLVLKVAAEVKLSDAFALTWRVLQDNAISDVVLARMHK